MVKATTMKHHREEQQTTKQTSKTSGPMSALGEIGPTVVFGFVCRWFSRWCLLVFALTSLLVLFSLVSPMAFDMYICALDSSKKLGRGRAPLLNKAFTLHEFPYIRGSLV